MMKKILSKYFLLSICCFGLNSCATGVVLGTVAVGTMLLTDSNGCHSGCGNNPFRSKDGKHTFNNSGETDWYNGLSQSEKDLLNKNSDICWKRMRNIPSKQCHIELGSPCYKRKGRAFIFNHCCEIDDNSCQ